MTQVDEIGNEYHCKQCNKVMTLLEYLVNPVCHACCVKNQREVAGRKK